MFLQEGTVEMVYLLCDQIVLDEGLLLRQFVSLVVLIFGYTGTGSTGLFGVLASSGVVWRRRFLPLSLEGTNVWGSWAGAERFLCASSLVVVNTV